ncbi:MAG: DUF262 domain-containing protein [Candidatus Nanoarchaeia archaeon]
MSKKFDLEDKYVYELLETSYFFKVPDYQREYSWDNSQIDDFISDVIKIYENKDIDKYFFGALVLIRDQSNNKKHYIVDGQQRLTTILIFLSVIKENLSDQYEKNIIQDNYLKTIDGNYKLELNKNNEGFFKLFIQSPNSSKIKEDLKKEPNNSNKLIFKAYKRFEKQIEKYIKDKSIRDKNIFLLEIKRCLIEKVNFVKIDNENEEIASLIFKVLNTRGKGLTEDEIIKNEVIWKCKKDEREDIILIWNNLLDSFYEKFSDNFFYSYILNYNLIQKSELIRDFEDRVENGDITFINFALNLKEDIEILHNLRFPKSNFFKNRDLLNDINTINGFKVEQIYLLLLASYKKNFYFKEVLEISKKFVFKNKFSKNLPFKSRPLIHSLSKKIINEEFKNHSDLKLIKNELFKLHNSEDQIKINFFQDGMSDKLLFTIMMKINGFSSEDYNLEHIFPKKKASEKFTQDFNEIKAKRNFGINFISNSTIIAEKDNLKASSRNFEEKLNFYKNERNYFLKSNAQIVHLTKKSTKFDINFIESYEKFIWKEVKSIFLD